MNNKVTFSFKENYAIIIQVSEDDKINPTS